jgi:hypothetical protein
MARPSGTDANSKVRSGDAKRRPDGTRADRREPRPSAKSHDRLTLEGIGGQGSPGPVFWLAGSRGDRSSHPARAGSGHDCSDRAVPTYSGGAAPASHRLPNDRDEQEQTKDDVPARIARRAGNQSHHGAETVPKSITIRNRPGVHDKVCMVKSVGLPFRSGLQEPSRHIERGVKRGVTEFLAEVSWRSPVGAAVTNSSDLPHRYWLCALGERAILTPTVQFLIAPRRFQRGQGQHSVERPTHPLGLATAGDRPVVEFLHRDPSPTPTPPAAVPPPPAEQGLRGDHRQQRGGGQAGDDPSDGPPAGQEVRAFSTRSERLSRKRSLERVGGPSPGSSPA